MQWRRWFVGLNVLLTVIGTVASFVVWPTWQVIACMSNGMAFGALSIVLAARYAELKVARELDDAEARMRITLAQYQGGWDK